MEKELIKKAEKQFLNLLREDLEKEDYDKALDHIVFLRLLRKAESQSKEKR
ncbi:MAG: hypothetical protein ACP5IV_07720 [Caldisericia bacterium]